MSMASVRLTSLNVGKMHFFDVAAQSGHRGVPQTNPGHLSLKTITSGDGKKTGNENTHKNDGGRLNLSAPELFFFKF